MDQDLSKQVCKPCKGSVAPMELKEIEEHLAKLDGWDTVNNHHLSKEYTFKDFKEALYFVNRVGAIAEEQGHHPDIECGWGYVRMKLYTHVIGGLSMNDFICAAKFDEALRDDVKR